MEELTKLTAELSNVKSAEIATISKECAKATYNGGKKVGGFISDIIDAIFD